MTLKSKFWWVLLWQRTFYPVYMVLGHIIWMHVDLRFDVLHERQTRVSHERHFFAAASPLTPCTIESLKEWGLLFRTISSGVD